MKVFKTLSILIILCLLGIYGFIQSGIFNVAAITKDGPIITWLLHTTMEKSVERRAQNIEVPDLSNDEMILAGVSDYVAMCAQCHGEPGETASILTQGLNPAPPDLEDLVEVGSASKMFWIINNGIRMSGMPAFGKTHNEDELWPVVSFLQSAKNITVSEYNSLKIKSENYGHHKSTTHIKETESHQHEHGGEHSNQDAQNDVSELVEQQALIVPDSDNEEENHNHHNHSH